MSGLTKEHIDHIIKDLNYRGIVLEGFQDEVIDHVCSAVENEMSGGRRFIDAYEHVLKTFGHTAGLRRTQVAVMKSKQPPAFMFRNHIRIAFRNHIKQKFYTLINIGGLATGIATCLIIVLFVIHQMSYDRFNENATRIFRLNADLKFGALNYRLATANALHAELLAKDFAEIESTVRLQHWGERFVRREESDRRVRENVVWADSTFFEIFSIPVLEGDARTALREANTIAISQNMALKYFPEGDAIGKSLILDDGWVHQISAVYTDIPDNSHFHFDFIVSMAGNGNNRNTSLVGGPEFQTYLLLREGASAEALQGKLPGFVNQYIAPQIGGALGGEFTMEKFRKDGNRWDLSLQSLKDIHLHGDRLGEFEANGSIVYVYLFSTIALFILVIACINFMNLSTARSANRAKEVGVRKVMGSLRSHLVRQFLTESSIMSLISFVLAAGLAYLAMPTFNSLAGTSLSVPFGHPGFYSLLLGAALLVGILAGLYPSFFLSAFKPIHVLKGRVSLGMKSGLVRSGLVVFQFIISISMIIGTIAINRQLSYIQEKKIGFQKDQIIVVHEGSLLKNQLEPFRNEVAQNSFIKSATISSYLPVSGYWRGSDTFWKEGRAPSPSDIDKMVSLQTWKIDTDYLKTLGMNLKSGRNFSPDFPSDSTDNVILNESALKKFGFGDNPLGQKITSFDGQKPDGSPDPTKIRSWIVVGVVEDFNFESLRDEIRPLAFLLDRSSGNIAFRFESTNTKEVISTIENTWKELAPGQPFQYSFLDDDFAKMYNNERKLGKVFAIFAGLAIAIACLGLFALAAFTAEQRTKEIGIRKALGASVNSIVLLLSKDFGKLVAIAFILSAPLSWYAVSWWLEDYAYRAEVGVSVYLAAGVAALVIALLTIGYQSVKAAVADPVKSLRSE